MEYFDADVLTDYFGSYGKYFTVVGATCIGYAALKIGWKALCLTVRAVKRSFAVDVLKYGRWAVITGCTDGIGKCYAMQMAEKGMDVVLISRNPEKLAETAKEIGKHTKVHVKVIAADFKKTDIYDHIKKELEGLDIGILVNNVGMGHPNYPCHFCEPADFEQFNMDVVNVNIMSCVMMTSIVLPEMLERKRGYIINVASGVCIRPLPYFTTYSSTKGFVRFFTEALNMECNSQGVTVQLMIPNMVDTKMAKGYAEASNIKPGLLCPAPDVFVKKAIQTIGRETVTAPHWPHEFQQYLMPFLPEFVVRNVLAGERNKMVSFLKKQ